MTMIKNIELDVLWHTDGTTQLEELGLDFRVEDLDKRPVTFYRIDAICPNYWDDKHEFCNVFVGGEKFICTRKYEEVKSLLDKRWL